MGAVHREGAKVSERGANLQPVSRGERAAFAAKYEPETDASQILSREAYPREELLRLR